MFPQGKCVVRLLFLFLKDESVIFYGFFLRDSYSDKGRHQNSKDVVTNLPLKLATIGN